MTNYAVLVHQFTLHAQEVKTYVYVCVCLFVCVCVCTVYTLLTALRMYVVTDS